MLEKEIPSLVPVKKEKETVASAPATENEAPLAAGPEIPETGNFTDEQLTEAWHKFRNKKLQEKISDSLKMVLKQELTRRGETELEITISTEIERKFLQGAETELVQFLRKELGNDSITLVSTIKAAEARQRLYTDKEKFNYLSEKQPLLLKLKERLFLDTDF